MRAQIIPVRRLPLVLNYLDYSIPARLQPKIKVGQLVQIPFGKKEVFGLVKLILKKDEKTNYKTAIKDISEVVLIKPMLSKQQLDFLSDMSDFYHVSLGFLLKMNLPHLGKRNLVDLNNLLNKNKANIQKQKPVKPRLFVYQNQKERLNYLEKNINSKKQTLIILPEIKSLDHVELPTHLKEKAIFITSELSAKEVFKSWVAVWRGDKTIIVGTRRTLFLPFWRLDQIFLDDEANPNHKSWDLAPRFLTRDATMFLATRQGATLHLMTHTPSVESYYFGKHGIYKQQLPPNQDDQKPKTIMVNMKDERKKGNYGFLSDRLVEEVRQVKTGDIFFFLNRRGTSSYVGCRDCGDVLKCTQCRRLLAYHQDTGTLKCHYCKKNYQIKKNCSNCHGVNMVMYGVGTQLAETEIKKLLNADENWKTIRIDSDNDLVDKNHDKNLAIIGTQLAWPYLDWKKVKLVVFLDADTTLFVPEYKVDENLWYLLRDARYRLEKKSSLLIQTSHPEHLVFSSLGRPDEFYEQELAARKLFGYPPYRFLLKLFYGHTDVAVAESEARQTFAKLLALTKDQESIKLSGPLESSPYWQKGKYWQIILAKIKFDNYKKDTKMILAGLSDNWKADPNPNSILSF